MPVPAYLTIKGAKQGDVSKGAFTSDSVGNIFQKGHEDQCLIQAFEVNVQVPRDPQSGQPTGVRVHHPSSVTKVFDKSSPLLWTALCTGETLQMELDFYRVSTAGQQQKYFTIKWTDAVLVDGKGYMPNCLDPANAHFFNMETWMFGYRKIEWDHVIAGTSGSDDWRNPHQG